MLTFSCPCGKNLQTSEANAGRTMRCPECGRTILAPGPTQAIQAEMAPPPAPAVLPATAIEEPRRPRPRYDDDDGYEPRPARPADGTSGKAIACLILGIASFCVPILPAIIGIVLGCIGLGDITRSRGRLSGKGLAIAGIVTAIVGNVMFGMSLVLLVPAVQQVRVAAARTQSQNNLKQIVLAFHSYNDTHRRLPPVAVFGKDGRPLYSWRVLLLPFVEQEPLFRQFKLDEPWDSPHNIALLPLLPPVYRHPLQDPNDTSNTHYQVFNGPVGGDRTQQAAFVSPTLPLIPFRNVTTREPVLESSTITRIPHSFRDGTSNTIL